MTYTTSNHQGQCIGTDLTQLLNFSLIDWLVTSLRIASERNWERAAKLACC